MTRLAAFLLGVIAGVLTGILSILTLVAWLDER